MNDYGECGFRLWIQYNSFRNVLFSNGHACGSHLHGLFTIYFSRNALIRQRLRIVWFSKEFSKQNIDPGQSWFRLGVMTSDLDRWAWWGIDGDRWVWWRIDFERCTLWCDRLTWWGNRNDDVLDFHRPWEWWHIDLGRWSWRNIDLESWAWSIEDFESWAWPVNEEACEHVLKQQDLEIQGNTMECKEN